MTRCVIISLMLAASTPAQKGSDPPDRVRAGPPLTVPGARCCTAHTRRRGRRTEEDPVGLRRRTIRAWDGETGRLGAEWQDAGAAYECLAVGPAEHASPRARATGDCASEAGRKDASCWICRSPRPP